MKTFVSVLCAMALGVAAAAQVPEGDGRRWAVVDLSASFMREAPDYTAELGDQALMGTVVEIIGEEGYWRKIVSPDPYTAWVTELELAEMSREQADAYIASPKYVCTADITYVYSEPSLKARHVSDFVMGGLVKIVSDSRGKPVKKGKFLACELPSGRQGWVPKADVHEFREWAQSLSLTGENVVETALRFLGVPYMWGGTSVKEADCSGLARVAYMMNGLLLPRNASQQARIGAPADLAALEPGDLLLFGTPATDEKPARVNHVGIYIGDNRFIHSSQYVRISSLDPAQPDYYERAPLFARRIIGHVEESPAVTPLLKSPWYFTQN